MRLSRVVTLLPLSSLVVWLAVDIAKLPRTPVTSCGLKFPSRENLGRFLEKKLEHSEKLETQSLKNNR